MANAAIYLNPEAYNTSTDTLMGRHSAGESFLKGFLRHADVPRFFLWNVTRQPTAEIDKFVRALEPVEKPVTWLGREQRQQIGEAGCVHFPTPHLAREAWVRRSVGSSHYSICGITHTTATDRVMDAIGSIMLTPVEPWDALICTSHAVKASVEHQLESVAEDLRRRLGATRFPKPRIETIPLGIDTASFATDPGQRGRWREQFGIPDDAVVALYVGRLNAIAKMNPLPMFLALERARQRTGRDIHFVLSGWPSHESMDKHFREGARDFCPSVPCHFVDGRKPEVRTSIWSVADFFLSLSDNIQETFGLTPVEAMAAGLPSIVSDWDGYKDTVRHGLDGFRISAYTPRPGLGSDLGFRHGAEIDSYSAYVGKTSQFTSVDVEEAVQAVCDLVNDAELRRRMGRAAQEQARATLDWRVIIPTYQSLWDELAKIRAAAPPASRARIRTTPWRPDPYELFASYPTEFLTAASRVAMAPGASVDDIERIYKNPLVRYANSHLPTQEESRAALGLLVGSRPMQVSELMRAVPPGRRPFMERGILFLAKYGVLTIVPRSRDLLPFE